MSDQRKTVLIVEDEPALARVLCDIFRQNTFQVVLANTLFRADYEIKNQRIDLIILDWMLPDGHGIDWLQTQRESLQGRVLGSFSNAN